MPNEGTVVLEMAEDAGFLDAFRGIDAPAVNDGPWHFRAGSRLEDLGEVELALREYNLAVRDGQRDPELLERIGSLYADTGRPRNAIRFFRQALEIRPERFETALRLGEILEELEQFDQSRDLFALLFERTRDPRYRRQLDHMEKTYFQARARPEVEREPWSDEVVLRFVDLFSGREGVHA
ncbi:MAG TPA: tetratricopeptide repeat protein, partial [Candidatus Aminicenantes bacterium]|nr:tetratricopeptide repeat protein [Candidatus Aminicenantes bacterium]